MTTAQREMAGATASAQPQPTPETQATSTRLTGRWLLAARLGWLATLLVTLGMLAAQLPTYLSGVAPENAAFNPSAVRALAQLGMTFETYNWLSFAILCLVTLASLALTLILAWRRSDDWMALLVSLFLVNYVISNIGITLNQPSSSPHSFAEMALAVAQSLPAFFITFAVLLLFPNGRFAPRWSWMLLLAITLWSIVITAQPDLFGGALFLGSPIVVGSTISCIVYRYRRASTSAQRQQTKWVVVGLIITLVANQLFWIPTGFTPLGKTIYPAVVLLIYQLALLLVPVTFFVAVQRYRLYDIDVIINRALVYGSLTVALVGVYAACVLGAQALVTGLAGDAGTEPVVIVGATLLIAALFRPLRARLQALVDHRFYRSKYDAARTVEGFSATLRHETELSALQDHLLETVEHTMQPAHASIWLRPSASARPDAAPRL